MLVWATDGSFAVCKNAMCALYNVEITPDEWRRLAAPPLHPTVVAVLDEAKKLRKKVPRAR